METPDLLAQGEMDYQVLVVDNQLGHWVEDTRVGRRSDHAERLERDPIIGSRLMGDVELVSEESGVGLLLVVCRYRRAQRISRRSERI